MKKRLTFLIVGFLCLNLSVSTFPLALNSFTTEILMHKLVFEPFKWLGSILLFISGFFTISRIIKMISENVMKHNSFNREALWIALVILGFIIIALNNFLVSIAAFVFSAFYGIMDANVHRKSRHYSN